MNRYLVYICLLVVAVIPTLVYGQTQSYQPIIGIPGLDPGTGLETYLNVLYIFAISAAAIIAVVKLVLAGFQYLLSDIVTNKQEAKKNIKSALVGLLIIMAAVVILRTINPNLVNLSALPQITSELTGGVIVHPGSNGQNQGGGDNNGNSGNNQQTCPEGTTLVIDGDGVRRCESGNGSGGTYTGPAYIQTDFENDPLYQEVAATYNLQPGDVIGITEEMDFNATFINTIRPQIEQHCLSLGGQKITNVASDDAGEKVVVFCLNTPPGGIDIS